MSHPADLTLYEIRIAGSLDPAVVHELDEDLDVVSTTTATVLRGRLRDEAELHGVLNRLRSAGARLVEVRRL